MTGDPAAVIEVISGREGSSENVARHVRDVSSGQVTDTAFSADVTVIGPVRSSVVSSVTVCPDEMEGRAVSSTEHTDDCQRCQTSCALLRVGDAHQLFV